MLWQDPIVFLSAGDDVSDPCLRFLYENGFNHINEVDGVGWSPFCYAALRGDPVLIKSFLANKANPNETTKKMHHRLGLVAGMSVLSFCSWWHHNEAAQLLIDAKAKLDNGTIASVKLAAHNDNVDAWHFVLATVREDRICPTHNTYVHIIHPASRGVAAHTAVVLRQFPGPKRGSEACGRRIIFLLNNNNPFFSTCEVPPNRCCSFFSPT